MIIPVANLGGQYNHLIARMLNELGVKSRLVSTRITIDALCEMGADGFVMGGGPQSLPRDINRLGNLPIVIRQLKIPILGICLTHQLICAVFGGKVGPSKHPEFGPIIVYVEEDNNILRGLAPSFIAWESHNDEVLEAPPELRVLAHSENCKVQVVRHEEHPIYGVQFHPEVTHTQRGYVIFQNFIEVCKGY